MFSLILSQVPALITAGNGCVECLASLTKIITIGFQDVANLRLMYNVVIFDKKIFSVTMGYDIFQHLDKGTSIKKRFDNFLKKLT